MNEQERPIPLSQVTLVFGAMSIPLAFMAHLVSLSLVLAVLAIVLGGRGTLHARRHLLSYTPASVKRMALGFRLGLAGMVCAIVMWMLWASNLLLQ